MRDTAASDQRCDTTSADQAPIFVVVVAAVGIQIARAVPWSASQAPDRWDRVDQGNQLGDVVAVTTSQNHRNRDTGGIGDQMVLGAEFASVDRARAGLAPL